jgi:hypothetical protein
MGKDFPCTHGEPSPEPSKSLHYPYPPKGLHHFSFLAMRYKAQGFPSSRESLEPYISLQEKKRGGAIKEK